MTIVGIAAKVLLSSLLLLLLSFVMVTAHVASAKRHRSSLALRERHEKGVDTWSAVAIVALFIGFVSGLICIWTV